MEPEKRWPMPEYTHTNERACPKHQLLPRRRAGGGSGDYRVDTTVRTYHTLKEKNACTQSIDHERPIKTPQWRLPFWFIPNTKLARSTGSFGATGRSGSAVFGKEK